MGQPVRFGEGPPSAEELERVRSREPEALAASIVLLVVLLNRGPEWTVLAARGVDVVVVDGVPVDCSTLLPLQAALHPGCRVEVPAGGQVELVAARQLALQLGDGIEMTVPSRAGRWFGRELRTEIVGSGAVRMATATGFEGARYRLRTDLAEVIVHGTTVSIERDEASVCICVLDGEVEAVVHGGRRHTIPAGQRLTLLANGGFEAGRILARERKALQEFRARFSPPFFPSSP